jgi:hypothetical protein
MTGVRILPWQSATDTLRRRECLGKKGGASAERSLLCGALMSCLTDVVWADCIRALRRAGFVCAAESPAAVMLVSAGRSLLLPRVRALDDAALLPALRATRLSAEEFLALLRE